jgi:fructokinase
MSRLFASIEAGGTKFMCAVGTGPNDLLASARIDTRSPEETLPEVMSFFTEAAQRHGALSAFGIGSFGPVDPDTRSPAYGHITDTPKPGWKNTDIVGKIRSRFDLPIGFDTDVNAAALGEAGWGAAEGLEDVLYLTVGTGVGGGALVGGRLVHGLMHPEMGHIRPRRRPEEIEAFSGSCPYHGDCLEGLASGTALRERWGKPADELPEDHPAWEIEADYLAQALATYALVISPTRMILGGGVMQQQHMFPRVRKKLTKYLGGYLSVDAVNEHIESYVVPPGLGSRSGIAGGFALAMRALKAA